MVVLLYEEEEGERFRLFLLKQFELGTPYIDVVSFIQRLSQKFNIKKGLVDQSAVGENLVEEIGAKKVFSVHTENTQLFKQIIKNVQRIKREKEYRI